MRGQHCPELDERAHDRDVDLDCTLAVQHGRKHSDALFGESVWAITTATVSSGTWIQRE
jgi:hypothetical protein